MILTDLMLFRYRLRSPMVVLPTHFHPTTIWSALDPVVIKFGPPWAQTVLRRCTQWYCLVRYPTRLPVRLRCTFPPVFSCAVHKSGILDELDPSERKLFSDNIRRLDKRIHQGMTKLTWSSKGGLFTAVDSCLLSWK